MTKWRYIAVRATTREILDLEVPFLDRSELSWALSASGSLKGTLASSVGAAKAQDGRPLFEEWGTLLYAEADGQIRWGGIVIQSGQGEKDWSIEAASLSSYPNGLPYLGEYYAAERDPAQVVRDIWDHLQNFDKPSGDLGMQIIGSTPTTVGSKSEAAARAATEAYDAAKAAYEDKRDKYTALRKVATDLSKAKSVQISNRTKANANLTATRKVMTDAKKDMTAAKKAMTAAKKTKDPAKIAAAQTAINAAQNAINAAQVSINTAQNGVNAANAAVDSADATYDRADKIADAAAKVRDAASDDAKAANDKKKKAVAAMKDDGGAYKMLWWEAPDCGQKISGLATDTPFDFLENHAWNATKTGINHRIEIRYPRAGRRRDDLAFIVGDNVIVQPSAATKGDDFANAIFGLGNGDGSATVHTSTAISDGRLRRAKVLSRKETKSKASLDAKARDALIKSAAGLALDQITVRDHPNAAIGSWELGDDILISFTLPGLGKVDLWHRIVAWSLLTESTASLKLERTDSFTYGALARD